MPSSLYLLILFTCFALNPYLSSLVTTSFFSLYSICESVSALLHLFYFLDSIYKWKYKHFFIKKNIKMW